MMTKKLAKTLKNEINSLLVWDRMAMSFDFTKDDMKDWNTIVSAWNSAAKALNEAAGSEIVKLRKG